MSVRPRRRSTDSTASGSIRASWKKPGSCRRWCVDGLSQVEAAQLLNKHKSWVCRRLALLERLGVEAQAELRLGLLSPGLARQLTRLPVGNQAAVLTAARQASLTMTEVQGVIDLLRGATPEQEALLLQDPRAALQAAK